ncbi:hypothetical protein N665_0357s0003 [Sinapis alba]|nr:hypothetical protein N665_0357s0003 [Sinapis alba]
MKAPNTLPTRSKIWEHYTRTKENRDFSYLIFSVAWKHFCKKMNLDKPISRRTSTRDIVNMYLERKAAMKKWFVANKQRVSLTTDIWEAKITRASYMVVTAHYIDECWRLKKLIIGFKHVSDHKGQTISQVLLDVLADWGIEKLFCVIVDNATSNSSALRRFHSQFSLPSDDALVLDGEFLHMRCSAHIINLIVKDGFTDVDQSVDAV